MDEREKLVIALQKNLTSIRTIAGWTAEELGYLIGVTKQTISNLENGKTQMSLTQYIAIRTILDYKIKENKETNKDDTLEKVVSLILDQCEDISEEEFKKRIEIATSVSALTTAGVGAGAIAAMVGGILAGGPVGWAIVGAAAAEPWIASLIKKKTKRKNK